eukprot:5096071-Amphidinium_carterae.1
MGLIQGIRNGTKEKTWGKDEWVRVLGRELEVCDSELESWTYGRSVLGSTNRGPCFKNFQLVMQSRTFWKVNLFASIYTQR